MATAQRIQQSQQANQTLTIELTTPIDDSRPVYIVGNFNNWNVDEQRFKLRRWLKANSFSLSLRI